MQQFSLFTMKEASVKEGKSEWQEDKNKLKAENTNLKGVELFVISMLKM